MFGSIIIGIAAGYIASRLQRGEGSGCLVNLFLGIVGGLLGGWLFAQLGIVAYSWVGELITSVVGAVLLLWLVALIRGK